MILPLTLWSPSKRNGKDGRCCLVSKLKVKFRDGDGRFVLYSILIEALISRRQTIALIIFGYHEHNPQRILRVSGFIYNIKRLTGEIWFTSSGYGLLSRY